MFFFLAPTVKKGAQIKSVFFAWVAAIKGINFNSYSKKASEAIKSDAPISPPSPDFSANEFLPPSPLLLPPDPT